MSEPLEPPPSAGLADLLSGDLSELVPDQYAGYRPLIASALAFFLGRLPEARQQEILRAGLKLGAGASLIERVVAVVSCCPTLHKLGQVVSRDQRLSRELRQRLQTLEVLPPSMTGAEVGAIVRAEIGELPPGLELAPEPLAEASVAIVQPFHWRPKNGLPELEGVFKVLKPGIEERLTEELAIWPELGVLLEHQSRLHGLATPDYRDAVERVRELLAMEVCLDQEQQNLRRAQASLGAVPGVAIPVVLPFCTQRLTAMTRLVGGKITELAYRPHGSRLADRLVSALIARPLLLPRGPALFHADPHAGNLLATGDGELGILDWALVGEIDKRQRIQITQILIGASTLDPRRIQRAVERLAITKVEPAAIDQAVERALGRLRSGTLPGLDWLFSLLDDLAVEGRVRFPGELILFRKSLLTVRGVIEEISPGFSIDLVLIRLTLSQALRDLPRRWLRNPFDRGFGTHVSNAEMLALLTAGPATLRRFLSQSLRGRTPRSQRSRR